MSAYTSWTFFSHETDLTILEQTLGNLYGIHVSNFQTPSDLNEIYTHALKLSLKLGANDETFFYDIQKGFQSNCLDYLVMDALFHVRKELSQGSSHRSLNQFLVEISKHDSSSLMDSSNFSRYMKRDFMSSLYPSLLGVGHNSPNSNYRVPMFMDRFLFFLITTIRKSPYRQATSSQISFSMLNTFFVKGDILGKVHSAYQEDRGNQCMAAYLSNRLFDIDTMTYIIFKLRNKKLTFPHEIIPLTCYLFSSSQTPLENEPIAT